MGRGFFETEDEYRSRTTQEANERIIEESTGSAPSRGFFESEEHYHSRINLEANERIIEDSTGSAPSRGFFESDEHYRSRLNQEANERIIEDSTGSAPSKGFFETDADYRRRIALEAREHQAEEHGSNTGGVTSFDAGSGSDYTVPASQQSGAHSRGWLWIVLSIVVIFGLWKAQDREFVGSSDPMASRTATMVLSTPIPKSEALPVFAPPKASPSAELIDQMAREIPDVKRCLAQTTKEQVLAALDVGRLDLTPSREDIWVSGAGREPCSLFGARMPFQWIYERTDGGYRQLLDVGPVDTIMVLPQEHAGYKDLRISRAFLAGRAVFRETYLFDGDRYHPAGDAQEVPIQEEPAKATNPASPPQLAPAQPTATPSFDCTSARTSAEKLICRDAELASLEQAMASAYKRVLQSLRTGQKGEFRRAHLEWFKSYARACNGGDEKQLRGCIVHYLSSHTGDLQARLR